MTDQQWNSGTNPEPMLEFLGGRANDRKLLLFAVACCRRVGHLMTDPRHRDALEAAERFADGLITEEQFNTALGPVRAAMAQQGESRAAIWAPFRYITSATAHLDDGPSAPYAASFAACGLACSAGEQGSPAWEVTLQAEEAAQCHLLRDLFGDPSRPFRFDPDWLDGDGRVAVERARQIDRGSSFNAVRSLADVLEQVGCRDQTVLEHCRQPGPHARGCWVVDALLGRQPAVRSGLLTDADWRGCGDPAPLMSFLKGKGSNRKWRLFAIACCGRIHHLITDERSRRAVEVAARYADGAASEEEFEAARNAAQEAQDEAAAAEYAAEAEANFCITPAYAAVCRQLYAATAARGTVCREPRKADAEPGTFEANTWRPSDPAAACAVNEQALAHFGSAQGDAHWEEARRAAESAGADEARAQCDLLRDLFGAYLGPPGEDGAWLPTRLARGADPRSPGEQWCLLPRPRDLEVRPEWLAWNGGTIPRIAQDIYEEQTFDRLPILADALEDAGCTAAGLLEHCRGPEPHVRGCWALDLLLGRE